MKPINRKYNSQYFMLLLCLFLTACEKVEAPMAWDGQWQRTISVPNDIQGRCVDEVLSIHDKDWHLKIIVHSTFKCDQPFLELAYAGNIQEVQIKRNTEDKDIRLQVSKIHLVEMADLSGKVRTPLTKSTVAGLSKKYVPRKYEFFEQNTYLSEDGETMQSLIYQPVIDLAMPEYPEGSIPESYQRVNKALKLPAQ